MSAAPCYDSTPFILSTQQMVAAESYAVEQGISIAKLMDAAGCGVASYIKSHFPGSSVLVVCGSGNNGGDGFVAARALHETGVQVGILAPNDITGYSAVAKAAYERSVGLIVGTHTNGISQLDKYDVIVDALLGTGLKGEIRTPTADLIEAINQTKKACVSVDIPSGICSDTGKVCGVAMQATATVTFFRKKWGHLLAPGSIHSGTISVVDIGIDAGALENTSVKTYENTQALWSSMVPFPGATAHKYTRGYTIVVGSSDMHGAARLAAASARRCGIGVLRVLAPASVHAIYAADAPGLLLTDSDNKDLVDVHIKDTRVGSFLIGAGWGASSETQSWVKRLLGLGKAVVLDAGALVSYGDSPQKLRALISDGKSPVLLTPHAGEFACLCQHIPEVQAAGKQGKLAQVRAAAKYFGATVLLKGSDTVIAAPEGLALVNSHCSRWLSVAGTGDVLAGLCAGFMAQAVTPVWAAAMAAWLHGDAALRCGPGFLAEDLVEATGDAYKALCLRYFQQNSGA